MKKVNIGIVGLAFGKEFLAIYKEHPLVNKSQYVHVIQPH